MVSIYSYIIVSLHLYVHFNLCLEEHIPKDIPFYMLFNKTKSKRKRINAEDEESTLTNRMTSRIFSNYIPPSVGIISNYLKSLTINIQTVFYATNLIILNFPLKILNIPFTLKILNIVNFLILNLEVTMIMEKVIF